MNYLPQFFNMLGIDQGDDFYLTNGTDHFLGNPQAKYHLDEKLILKCFFATTQEWVTSDYSLLDILKGNIRICKKPVSENDDIIIKYAKLCGYAWVAKDENNQTWAFKEKPEKSENGPWWIGQGYLLEKSLSCLDWSDKEPLYIGDA